MDDAAVAAEKESKAHGCCCSACKLIWELKFALGFDIFIFVAGWAECKGPLPFKVWICIYLLGIVLPSIFMFASTIRNGNVSGAPRRRLLQFLLLWKIPGFIFMYYYFFAWSPWAIPVAEYMCDPKMKFKENMLPKMFHYDFDKCVKGVPGIMIPSMIPRLIIYAYSVKGAYEYFRCHPQNDAKGIFTHELFASNYLTMMRIEVVLCLLSWQVASASLARHTGLGPIAAPNGMTLAAGSKLHDLQAEGEEKDLDADGLNAFFVEKAQELPPWKKYKPACINHVRELVVTVDNSYTDLGLKQALKTECHLDKEFTYYEDGFHNMKTCKEFSKRLQLARKLELDTGSTYGYKDFCARYYEHRGGEVDEEDRVKDKEDKKKAPKKGRNIAPWYWTVGSIAVALALCGVAYFVVAKNHP